MSQGDMARLRAALRIVAEPVYPACAIEANEFMVSPDSSGDLPTQ